jgi:ElaB/YqjD/DUF883 family membrane-anchored ribosome-binding protein
MNEHMSGEKTSDASKEPAEESARDRMHDLKAHAKEAKEHAATRAGEAVKWARNAFREPKIGIGVAGAAVLGVGAIWGVTEALLLGAVGLVAHRMLKKQRDRKHSAENTAAEGAAAEPASA